MSDTKVTRVIGDVLAEVQPGGTAKVPQQWAIVSHDAPDATGRVAQQWAIVQHDAPDATARVYHQWIILVVKNRRPRNWAQVVG